MVMVGALNLILLITFLFGGYYYGFLKGKQAGQAEESAKYVDKVEVVKKETVG